MSFRPAGAAPAPRVAAAAAPPAPARRWRSGLFSDAITLRPGVAVPRSAPTSGEAPAQIPLTYYSSRLNADASLTPDQRTAAMETEAWRRRMIEEMRRPAWFLDQYPTTLPLEVLDTPELERMYRDFSAWQVDQERNARPGPALASDEQLHSVYTDTADANHRNRRFRIADDGHPGHNPEMRAAFAPSLAEESATGGMMDKLKGLGNMGKRSAKAAADLDSWTLDCDACKNRGDPPSLDAVAFTSAVADAPVPVVVVATHKQWKPTKTTPGFSVPKAYTDDDGDYITDFVDAARGNPSGRFPWPPTADGTQGRALQSFRDVVFAAGLRKATYMTHEEEGAEGDNPARRSAMGRGHPAVRFASVAELRDSALAYPYSCVRDALLQGGKGGNGGLLQYVESKGDLEQPPAHEQQPSVLPHPANGSIEDACVYTAMAAVWIPYDLPRLWSRYVCILVPIGASQEGGVAMGHAIFVPHKDYGVVASPLDPKTRKLRTWGTADANFHLKTFNFRGDRGTIGGNAKLPGYDLLGAYALDTNMASGKDKAPSSQGGYDPAVRLASRDLIVPYLKASVDAFVSNTKAEERHQMATESLANDNQLGALQELNKTFRERLDFDTQKLANPKLAYRTYVETIVKKVAGFNVEAPTFYDHAMLDTAARAARALVQSKGKRAGLALGLGALLADYGERKKGSKGAHKTAKGALELHKHDYDRTMSVPFTDAERALGGLWDAQWLHDHEEMVAACGPMAAHPALRDPPAPAAPASSSGESESEDEGAE